MAQEGEALRTGSFVVGDVLVSWRSGRGATIAYRGIPVFAGNPSELAERPLYFSHDYDVEAVRVGRWKLIDRNSHYVWPVPIDKTDTPGGKLLAGRDYRPPGEDRGVPTLGTWPLLYDLERDREEAYNVAASHPARVQELGERLDAWRTAFRENPRGWRAGGPR